MSDTRLLLFALLLWPLHATARGWISPRTGTCLMIRTPTLSLSLAPVEQRGR